MIPALAGLLRLFSEAIYHCPTCGDEIPAERQTVMSSVRWGNCPCMDTRGRRRGDVGSGYDPRQPQWHNLSERPEDSDG